MSLNVRTIKSNTRTIEPMGAGTYPARIVGMVDMGMQLQQDYEGKAKPPAQMVGVSYEFLDEFLKDDDGQDQLDKPRWLSETFKMSNISQDLATSTKRVKAFDPEDKAQGDLYAMLGNPVMVTVSKEKRKKDGKEFNKIMGVTAMRAKDAVNAPALVNKPFAFDLASPDLEVLKKQPAWIVDKIKTNLNFAGSPLEAALAAAGETVPPKQEAQAVEETDGEDKPY